MIQGGQYEVRFGLSNPSLSCACLQYVVNRRLSGIPGAVSMSIIPPEMSNAPDARDYILCVVCNGNRLAKLFEGLRDVGCDITCIQMTPLDPDVTGSIVTTVFACTKDAMAKTSLLRAQLATISGIVFSGTLTDYDIAVVHDETMCSSEAVKQTLQDVLGPERVDSIRNQNSTNSVNLKKPTMITLNSLCATLCPEIWLLDHRLPFMPVTFRSLWTVISGITGFMMLVNVRGTPLQTLSTCRKLPGFMFGYQLKNCASYVMLFTGLFVVFLAALIEHDFSPRYGLQCISYSNFILASAHFYDVLTPKFRRLFLAHVKWRGTLYTNPTSSTGSIVGGAGGLPSNTAPSMITYKHGDIIDYDCLVLQTAANVKISAPPFSTNDLSNENLHRPCEVGQILYQGQQILSGDQVLTKILRTNRSVSQILSHNSQTSSLLAPYLINHRPYLKLYIRYAGILAFIVFILHWLLKMTFDPIDEYDSDEFLLDAIPRVTLNAAIVSQIVSTVLLYDSLDLMLIYVKQLLVRKAKVITTQTVDLLRLIGMKRIVFEVGDLPWIQSVDLISLDSTTTAATTTTTTGSSTSTSLPTTTHSYHTPAPFLELDETKLNLAPKDSLGGGSLRKCYVGQNAHYLSAVESLFGVSVEIVGDGLGFHRQVELFRSLLPASWSYKESNDASRISLWIRSNPDSKARQSSSRVIANLVTERNYMKLDDRDIALIDDLKGILSLFHWAEVAKNLTDRATTLGIGYIALSLLAVLSTFPYVLIINSSESQLWIYTITYILLANGPLLHCLICLNFNAGILTKAGRDHHNLLNLLQNQLKSFTTAAGGSGMGVGAQVVVPLDNALGGGMGTTTTTTTTLGTGVGTTSVCDLAFTTCDQLIIDV